MPDPVTKSRTVLVTSTPRGRRVPPTDEIAVGRLIGPDLDEPTCQQIATCPPGAVQQASLQVRSR